MSRGLVLPLIPERILYRKISPVDLDRGCDGQQHGEQSGLEEGWLRPDCEVAQIAVAQQPGKVQIIWRPWCLCRL